MASQTHRLGGRWRAWLRGTLIGIAFVVVVTLLMMYLAGTFHDKIDSDTVAAAPRLIGNTPLAPARLISVPTTESAVGTIRAVRESAVASKLLAKIVEMRVTAGQRVQAGDVLARLDDADLRAQHRQAVANADAARAARDQAQIEHDRVQGLFADGSAAKIERDRVVTGLRSAEANLERAEQGVREAETVLEYATIRAPMDGVVVDKLMDVGDTATPGAVLLTLYDPTHMQLVASVRESLAQRLSVGNDIDVRIDALNRQCTGRISEIVPEAEAATRSFSVKVTGPCPPGIYSGMFGRLLIPLDTQEVLVIPTTAVRRVGQLDLVDVVEEDEGAGGKVLRRRIVLPGRTFGDSIEILSGLAAGELVALPPTSAAQGGTER